MTVELFQTLWIIAIVAIASAILIPVLTWILPDRTKSA
ncbi:hypothetical protein Ple7327_2639 [Pleurocapsa sp. PCC 7327]|nr:hypothetical protein Ple7327_2639 [Pleurocapsa sp. PCC 7327]